MRLNTTNMLNGISIAGVGAMMIAGASFGTNPGIDPITTASVPTARPFSGDMFMALDHRTNQTCLFALHRDPGYDVHRIEPAKNCATLGTSFAAARAWREDRVGMVTVTDHRGNELLKLARGDGFAWEVVSPRNVEISFSAY